MSTTTARRRNRGADLRDAMYAADMTCTILSKRTKQLDPGGAGVSFQLIAFLSTKKPWGRETTTWATACLIERALDVPDGTLFETTITPQPAWSAL